MRKVVTSSARVQNRLRTAGLACVFAAQFVCFCLCGSGASAPVNPHAGCHQSAAMVAANASTSSLASPKRTCCSGMGSRALVTLRSSDPLPVPLSALSSIASFATPNGQITPLGSAAAVIERSFSPPRSPILRI